MLQVAIVENRYGDCGNQDPVAGERDQSGHPVEREGPLPRRGKHELRS
jgi:hypothetical protein